MHGGSLLKDAWFLVCSGALVNERTVVVAAHCVTDLGRANLILSCNLSVPPTFNLWVGKIPWRRKWQTSAVFLPGEFHGQRSLVGYSP